MSFWLDFAQAIQLRWRVTRRTHLPVQLFVGRGRCNVCHFGPRFTHEEFAEIGIGYFTSTGVDKGRYAGIDHLKANRYNLLGPFSDGPTSGRANLTRRVVKSPGTSENFACCRCEMLRERHRTCTTEV